MTIKNIFLTTVLFISLQHPTDASIMFGGGEDEGSSTSPSWVTETFFGPSGLKFKKERQMSWQPLYADKDFAVVVTYSPEPSEAFLPQLTQYDTLLDFCEALEKLILIDFFPEASYLKERTQEEYITTKLLKVAQSTTSGVKEILTSEPLLAKFKGQAGDEFNEMNERASNLLEIFINPNLTFDKSYAFALSGEKNAEGSLTVRFVKQEGFTRTLVTKPKVSKKRSTREFSSPQLSSKVQKTIKNESPLAEEIEEAKAVSSEGTDVKEEIFSSSSSSLLLQTEVPEYSPPKYWLEEASSWTKAFMSFLSTQLHLTVSQHDSRPTHHMHT